MILLIVIACVVLGPPAISIILLIFLIPLYLWLDKKDNKLSKAMHKKIDKLKDEQEEVTKEK